MQLVRVTHGKDSGPGDDIEIYLFLRGLCGQLFPHKYAELPQVHKLSGRGRGHPSGILAGEKAQPGDDAAHPVDLLHCTCERRLINGGFARTGEGQLHFAAQDRQGGPQLMRRIGCKTLLRLRKLALDFEGSPHPGGHSVQRSHQMPDLRVRLRGLRQ